jgi:hypothetical protein
LGRIALQPEKADEFESAHSAHAHAVTIQTELAAASEATNASAEERLNPVEAPGYRAIAGKARL